jgi:uncharacterized protein YegP (UPF0339 family)
MTRYTLEVYRDGRGEHRWRFIAPNKRIIADSGEGYTKRSSAVRAARRLAVVASVAVLSGCANLGTWDRAGLLGPKPIAPDATPALVASYTSALEAAQAAPTSGRAIAAYVDASIALTDASCLAWLDRVIVAQQSLRLGGGGLDVTSALATTIMGIAQAPAAVVGGVGAGFAALAGYGKAVDTTLLAAPSTYQAQARLMAIMGEAADGIRADPGRSWLEAYGRTSRYARLCSYQTMQAVVDDALAATATQVGRGGVLRTVPK